MAVTNVLDNPTALLALVAVIEGAAGVYLIGQVHALRARLDVAVEAAEDAARAAALAAPGGIDPEVVIDLIRQGRTANLDTIHALMERQAASEE